MKKFKLMLLGLACYISAMSQNAIPCNSWLSTTTTGQCATLGDIDVAGNQITVEASYNRTFPLNPNSSGPGYPGHLVSKHSNPFDINYSLYPNGCAISTVNSPDSFSVFESCGLQLNRTYHVALVYDGTTLSFYRDGFLMGQTPCTGNLINNAFPATIGQYAFSTGTAITQFKGNINEVRIWSVARTQAQLNAFMNTTLPNPATQPGLVAYYRFNSLVDLTGNNANATLVAGATSNATNPNCAFTPIGCCGLDATTFVTKCSNQNITLSARAGTTYAWSPSTGLSATNIQNPICSATTNTTYTVHVTNTANNCINDDIVAVTVNPPPVSHMSDTSICAGDTIQLFAGAGTSYTWSPNTNISNIHVQDPLVWPAITTTYIVTITNANGCSINDTITVTVTNCIASCEDSCNWSLTGNSNVKVQNFIGPKNNADFKIRTNNIQRAVVTAAGNVGINTATPAKLLDVNGEAAIRTLPARALNDNIVFANASGELKSLQTPNDINQYLSGDGSWQVIPTGTTNVNADQGCTLIDGNTVVLGDVCGRGERRGLFKENREINMDNNNLYFNSSETGKLYMGNTNQEELGCRDLYTRLEINADGLRTSNSYSSDPSPSGLRFTNLTSITDQITNESGGVLSLDRDGDVIWVQGCCDRKSEARLDALEERIVKLENELKSRTDESSSLKEQLSQMDVLLSKNNVIVLNQNVPNPFAESTVITYNIPKSFSTAQIIFSTINGEVIKTAEIKKAGKGEINVFAKDISSGLYTYTLLVDGKVIDTKKMIKQ